VLAAAPAFAGRQAITEDVNQMFNNVFVAGAPTPPYLSANGRKEKYKIKAK
jgi:hypothetical protein